MKTKHSSGVTGAAKIEGSKNMETKHSDADRSDRAVKVKVIFVIKGRKRPRKLLQRSQKMGNRLGQ